MIVTFPYISNDKYEGTIGSVVKNSQKYGIYFKKGNYTFNGGHRILFEVKEVKNIFDMDKVKDRGLNFSWMFEQIIERQPTNKAGFEKFLERIVKKKNLML